MGMDFEKNGCHRLIYRFESGLTKKYAGFSCFVYFGFGLRKLYSKPKSLGWVRVGFSNRVSFCHIYIFSMKVLKLKWIQKWGWW